MNPFFDLPPATERLFAFPHAGGSDLEPSRWTTQAPVSVVPVLLPGRGRRRQERGYRAMEPLVEDLAQALPTDVPFDFYGHSFGAWAAFELVRELRRRQMPLPRRLIVGARGAPGCPPRRPPMANLPQDDFIKTVAENFGGVPERLLDRPEILGLFLPPLRNDIRLLERWKPAEEAPIPVPILALHATDDPSVHPEDVQAWAHHTSASFEMRAVTGGHFFHRTLDIPEILS